MLLQFLSLNASAPFRIPAPLELHRELLCQVRIEKRVPSRSKDNTTADNIELKSVSVALRFVTNSYPWGYSRYGFSILDWIFWLLEPPAVASTAGEYSTEAR